MNKKIYSLSLMLLVLALTSCGEVTEAGKFDNWRSRNEAFMDSLQTVYDTAPDRGGLQYITPMTNTKTRIFYKDITPSTNVVVDQQPLYTQSVSAYYRGSYIFGETFDENFTGTNPNLEFDSPSTFKVTGVISGWTEILQYMKIGQRWMVYIPWVMGYGTSGSGDIPGYSTLIFDMELYAIK